ncbi:hypothetical protein OIO90_001295 [Microbotryomycetes sp. JL221]|nr:hypothetical protein OIO90_001295 [Microbotryomycetes sp. JL221]
MSTPTPVSRRTSTNSIFSPPSSISNFGRRASHASVASSSTTTRAADSPRVGTPASVTSERKRRNRDLLRDYYGLATEGATNAGSTRANALTTDALDIDNPTTFVPEAYFHQLSQNASLTELLGREEELITGECSQIRELDGERQSIVYNHHHELIEASDTIRKMKSRAEALDTSLDSLKSSLESISQLSAALAPTSRDMLTTTTRPKPRLPMASTMIEPSTPKRRTLSTLDEDPTTPTPSKLDSSMTTTTTTTSHFESPPRTISEPGAAAIAFDPLIHLPALLSLPIMLRALIEDRKDRKAADSLWGEWEPTLRVWEDEQIQGAKEIGMECRDVLKRRRANSGAPRPDLHHHVVVK